MDSSEIPIIQVSDLTVRLNNNLILDHVSFEVNSGETVAVIGPNGAGKTVLFRCLLGLIPYSGTISWAPNIRIGYVPQRLYIEPDLPLTTKEFMYLKTSKPTEITHALNSVGFTSLTTILKKPLGTLSGGELQRVLIAWAHIGHPDVLLFDEPTAGVDISSEETIYSLLHKLQEKEKMTILLISHEMQVVYRYADKVICLNKEKVCFGPPLETLTKETLAQLFGKDTGLYKHQHDHHD